MENWVYFSALAIAFGLGFAVCAAVFADRIGGRTPSASHNSSSMPRECEHRWDGEGQCMRCGHLLGQPFRRGIR